jgi:hypothetical protein
VGFLSLQHQLVLSSLALYPDAVFCGFGRKERIPKAIWTTHFNKRDEQEYCYVRIPVRLTKIGQQDNNNDRQYKKASFVCLSPLKEPYLNLRLSL